MLGKIRQVDLREVWPSEAQSFTPWLEANPGELGELLGLELEFVREKAVGRFSLDLFGTDLNTGEAVIVENQLEKSDHSHLGQLLTYAGGLEPSVIVWIAKEIREEHRAALEWLNAVTNLETQFFGIEVKAIRIDDSPPAPWLDIVVQPNAWSKNLRGSSTAYMETDRGKKYSIFWQELLDVLAVDFPELKSRTAWARTWFPTSLGVSGVNLNFVFGSQGLRVEFYLGSSDESLNRERFEALKARPSIFEHLGTQELSWESLEGKKACRIALYGKPDADITTELEWSSYIDWFSRAFKEMRLTNTHEFRSVLQKSK